MSEHTPERRSTSGYAKKIEQLIEQRDSLRAVNAVLLEALTVARGFVSTDRASFIETCSRPDGLMDSDDAAAVSEYDAALFQIDAAIASARKQENQHG